MYRARVAISGLLCYNDFMNELDTTQKKLFDDLRHIDENGNEYWLARELQTALQYAKWENFHKVIKTAQIACKISQQSVDDHFPEVRKMVEMPTKLRKNQAPDFGFPDVRKTKTKPIIDYKLTRYACYLIGLFIRGDIKQKNMLLAEAAKKAGIITSLEYATFQDAGYQGLYGGMTAQDIAENKGLKDGEEILDFMGSEELAANLFRITQTEAKMRREGTDTPQKANAAHYQVGKAVRETIKGLGGTMPEDLPTPEKSIKELEAETRKQLKSKKD